MLVQTVKAIFEFFFREFIGFFYLAFMVHPTDELFLLLRCCWWSVFVFGNLDSGGGGNKCGDGVVRNFQVLDIHRCEATEALFDMVNNEHRIGLFTAWCRFADV